MSNSPKPYEHLSRRELLALIGTVGAAAAFGIPERAGAAVPTGASAISTAGLLQKASAIKAAGSDLGAVEHVVFLMMENRSYDHYFGAYPKGRGFDDHGKTSLGAFEQAYPAGTALVPPKQLLPFHLTQALGEGCTMDLTHDWGPMHQCWNNGRMDAFVQVHTSSANEGSLNGALTMGYYTRDELPFYWSAADHFTLADGYHASILGPTHPNRLMANTGTIDPAGGMGGPITDTSGNPDLLWSCTWPTVQEVLQDAGVSWKVYHPSFVGLSPKYAHLATYPTWNPVIYNPTLNPAVMLASDHVLPYFKAFENPLSPLYQKAFTPTFPNDFTKDIAAGTLPSVSWLIPPLGFDEHPSASPDRGAYFTQLVLDALMADKNTWSKTVLFLMYDENDGWFDHVPPPTAPAGTAGEWLTAPTISSETLGFRGPLGLGVRVPAIAMSPFSRGGHVASQVFDHTSQLKLLHERFGVAVPNVSAWRQKTVGDLTSMLFLSAKDMSMPALPTVPLPPQTLTGACNEITEDTETGGSSPTIPTKQRMPTQKGTTTIPPAKPAAAGDLVHVARGSRGSTQKANVAQLTQVSVAAEL
ncbi:phospholipase C [Acidothermaceae bacterium B102]|nr:phospholipase C [Acidothermaceae bacterium B102]